MQESPPTTRPPTGTGSAQGAGTEALERLRELILTRTSARLEQVEQRLADGERFAKDVARVLPQAVVLRTQSDERLASSLAPTIEDALHASIEANPKPVTDAIFPILGPAIRKSIAHAMSGLLDSVNQSAGVHLYGAGSQGTIRSTSHGPQLRGSAARQEPALPGG